MTSVGAIGHTETMGGNEKRPRSACLVVEVSTDVGPGRLLLDSADDEEALLLLGHGAGGGVEAADLAGLAELLPPRGIGVLRFEQPWRVAGRRLAGTPASLDLAWRAALPVAVELAGGVPFFVGGRSAGARVACRCFAPPARGIVALSFPLHPPGKPVRSRVAELSGVAGSTLVLQGARDPFGTADEVASALAELGTRAAALVALPDAGHSLDGRTQAARERQAGLVGLIAGNVETFIRARL